MNELQAHIEAQNAQNEGSFFAVVSDPAHWAGYGITTVYEYEHYMAANTYIDVYKEVNGIKPRWMNFDGMTTIQILMELDMLCWDAEVAYSEKFESNWKDEQYTFQQAQEAYYNQSDEEREAQHVTEWKPEPPPINNPFAALLG